MTSHPNHRTVNFLLLGLALFFCAGTLVAQLPPYAERFAKTREEFDPSLQGINSVDSATAYVLGSNPGSSPAARADAADEFVRRRFFHSYSFFDPGENWLAYLAGFVWLDLRSPVRPNDILQHPEAACSQQTIVFNAIVRRLGLRTAVVRLQGHMAAAVNIRGTWRVYDADIEIQPRSYPLTGLLTGDPSTLAIYGQRSRTLDLAGQAARGTIRLTDINGNPAPHATLFDKITSFLSLYGWAIFVALAALRFRQRSLAVPVARATLARHGALTAAD